MKADPMKTEFDVKKFVEVLDESRMMIPDSKRRLDDALHDLEDFVLSQQQQPQQQQQQQNSSSGWYATAKSILDEHFHNNNISNKGESSNGIGGDDIVVAGEETNVEDLKEGEEFWFDFFPVKSFVFNTIALINE